MNDEQIIKPIAYIHTDFKEKFGIPRQSGRAPALKGTIVFVPEYREPEALRGIEGYSHLWLIFGFSKARREKWSPTVRPPRLGGNIRRGVFASRSPFRPNSLGMSCVSLESVEKSEKDGTFLTVSGVDMLDMTPIYDIKPYLPYADSYPEARGGYGEEFKDYKLDVEFQHGITVPEDKLQAVIECLADDPRPSYQEDSERVYSMRFANLDIRFKILEKCVLVIDVEIINEK